MAPTGIPPLRLCRLPSMHGGHHTPSSSSSPAPLTPPLTVSCSTDGTSTTEQSYTHPTIAMPPPGPTHYEARRAVWLSSTSSLSRPPLSPPSPSASRAKLEALLSREDAVDDDQTWRAGLKHVWKGLVGGGKLRRRLPLAMVVKILWAGWLRDGTWPADAVIGPPSPLPDLDPQPFDETSKTDCHDEQGDSAMIQNQG